MSDILEVIGVIAVATVCALATITLAVVLFAWTGNALTETACRDFGEFSGYNVKVETTAGLKDCYAEVENGKWISTSLLRGE